MADKIWADASDLDIRIEIATRRGWTGVHQNPNSKIWRAINKEGDVWELPYWTEDLDQAVKLIRDSGEEWSLTWVIPTSAISLPAGWKVEVHGGRVMMFSTSLERAICIAWLMWGELKK